MRVLKYYVEIKALFETWKQGKRNKGLSYSEALRHIWNNKTQKKCFPLLTHRCRMRPIELSHHWKWHYACSTPSHYLNKCGILFVGPQARNKSQDIVIEIRLFSFTKCTWKRRLRNNIHLVSANVLNTVLRILARFRFFLGLDIWVHSEQLLLSIIV